MNQVFKALNDSSRREILELLKEGTMSVNEIVVKFKLSAPAISKHLSILKDAHLVTCRKEKTTNYYSLNAEALAEALAWLWDFSQPIKKMRLNGQKLKSEEELMIEDNLLLKKKEKKSFTNQYKIFSSEI